MNESSSIWTENDSTLPEGPAGRNAPPSSPSLCLLRWRFGSPLLPLPNFENLMDADHIHAWEQGNVAEALLAGRGFGSALMSNQPSAIMPPVYPLIVAVIFHFFGVHTAWLQYLRFTYLTACSTPLACIPIFLMARRSFGERAGWWAAWGWAFLPYGIYFSAAWAWSTHLLLLCLCWLLVLAQHMEQSPRLALWAGFGLLAGFAGLTEPSVAGGDSIPAGAGMLAACARRKTLAAARDCVFSWRWRQRFHRG